MLATAVVCLVLALAISEGARRRRDARLLLIGLAFTVSAGFLGLHALATPGVALSGKNAGFVLATPVGLVLAGVLRRRSRRSSTGCRPRSGSCGAGACCSGSCSR